MNLFCNQVSFEHKEKNGRYQLRKSLAEGEETAVTKKYLGEKTAVISSKSGKATAVNNIDSSKGTAVYKKHSLHDIMIAILATRTDATDGYAKAKIQGAHSDKYPKTLSV